MFHHLVGDIEIKIFFLLGIKRIEDIQYGPVHSIPNIYCHKYRNGKYNIFSTDY